MLLAAGTRLGPYEVLGLIGAGGMGEVYKARDTRLDRSVAIKVLPAELSADPERRARFQREAKTIAGRMTTTFTSSFASTRGGWARRFIGTRRVSISNQSPQHSKQRDPMRVFERIGKHEVPLRE